MAKDKLAVSPPGSAESAPPPQEAHAPDTAPASTYEACMRVYRWASRRYRKTLDALAK